MAAVGGRRPLVVITLLVPASLPSVRGLRLADLADDLRELGQPVAAGFSTHSHWDHMLWHARFGAAPRYGTARCAATVRDRLSDPGAKARIAAQMIPPGISDQVSLDLLGLITGLPAETAQIPWDGPQVRPAGRPIGQGGLGVGGRRARTAATAARPEERARRDPPARCPPSARPAVR
jgi:glyoxylase-like metal-dependent hydrolase (beta-lactamase superfamily II)